MGVTPGETSDVRNVGVSPGENELARKDDYLCILGLSATRWGCSPTV